MPSSSTLASLATKLYRAGGSPRHIANPLSDSFSGSLRCFSSKAKDKTKGKGKEKEEEDTTPSDKKSNKKPHWSQQVFYKVSSRLEPVLETRELTRPEAIERIWNYIKINKLQNENDEIVCDDALKKAFGQAKVQRSEILKFLDVNLSRLKPGCHA